MTEATRTTLPKPLSIDETYSRIVLAPKGQPSKKTSPAYRVRWEFWREAFSRNQQNLHPGQEDR